MKNGLFFVRRNTESLEIRRGSGRVASPTHSGRFCPGGAAAGELLALIMALLHLETSHLDVATARHLWRRFQALAGLCESVLCVCFCILAFSPPTQIEMCLRSLTRGGRATAGNFLVVFFCPRGK